MRKAGRRSIGREIQVVRRSLAAITRALQRLAPALEAGSAARPGNPAVRGRKLRLSAARRAALKLQGQYIGGLRNLKPKQKARVKALRAKSGLRAAIRMAKRLAKQ